MKLRRLLLATALITSPAWADETGHAAQQNTAPSRTDISYFVGRWAIIAVTPGVEGEVRFNYDVRPWLAPAWLSGHGVSDPAGEESRDVWGLDARSGEVIRAIFTAGGTYAIVRSKGWMGRKLVLEGEAQSSGGSLRVRETIEKVSDQEFTATWEAFRDGRWAPYSIERVTKLPALGQD